MTRKHTNTTRVGTGAMVGALYGSVSRPKAVCRKCGKAVEPMMMDVHQEACDGE